MEEVKCASRDPRSAHARSSERFQAVRARTLAIAEPFSVEAQQVQSMPDASPMKWHLAHTTWFWETFILSTSDTYRPFHAQFEALFNSYYNAVGKPFERAERGLFVWPALDDVLAYRNHVDEAMITWLADENVSSLVDIGLAHEEQHQELMLTDIKHALSRHPLSFLTDTKGALLERRTASSRSSDHSAGWHSFQAGLQEIGAVGDSFSFDNEYPRHRVWLNAFEIAAAPVTNTQVMAFIEADGYARSDLWLSDGWDFVSRNRLEAPLYWNSEADGWHHFSLSGYHSVEPDAPACHLSYYEADAIARFFDARLPTEAEWEVAASAARMEDQRFLEAGIAPEPERAHSQGGLNSLYGGVWEWTASAYLPYPGYKPARGAVGEYNGKFMSGQMVLRGGSAATPVGHIRPTYRNFFPPHARWQFSGLRLARDV